MFAIVSLSERCCKSLDQMRPSGKHWKQLCDRCASTFHFNQLWFWGFFFFLSSISYCSGEDCSESGRPLVGEVPLQLVQTSVNAVLSYFLFFVLLCIWTPGGSYCIYTGRASFIQACYWGSTTVFDHVVCVSCISIDNVKLGCITNAQLEGQELHVDCNNKEEVFVNN